MKHSTPDTKHVEEEEQMAEDYKSRKKKNTA